VAVAVDLAAAATRRHPVRHRLLARSYGGRLPNSSELFPMNNLSKILKSGAKKWVRPLFLPAVRLFIRYTPHHGIRRFVWTWVVAPFFQYANYRFVTTTVFGSVVSGNTEDLIQRYIYYFGIWEPNLTHFLRENLKEGDIFVDVGANIGYFTLQASRLVGELGKVIAIEASPKIYAKLIDNMKRDHATNVEAYNLAVSDSEGTTKVFLAANSNIGQTTILPKDGCCYECEINSKPLTAIIPPDQMAKVRLIKIDVEGAEWLVVSGMRPLLSAARDDLEIIV
jgi:FkbM family methyltransferase